MIISIDQLERTVSLADRPQKIISLVPSQTELLFDLGLDEEVAGITKFCVHPKQWHESKTRIGGTKILNIEKIRELRPDLIIANKEENEESQIKVLSEEFPVWISDVKTLADSVEMILELARITGRDPMGKSIVTKIESEFKTLVNSDDPVSCAYVIWKDPWMVAGGDTFISDMLNHCNYKNVFEKNIRYPEVTLKEIENKNPQILFLSSEPYPFDDKHRDELQDQFRDTIIELVDGEMFSWYGSRLTKAPSYFLTLRKKIEMAL